MRSRSSGTQCGLGRNRMSSTMSASTGMPYLKPKDTTVARSAAASPSANACLDLGGQLVHVEVEVSITRSASPRRSRTISRSRAMPSSSRPPPCSGCGRRAASCRRTSTSSVPRGTGPRRFAPCSADRGEAPRRSAKKPRERTSTTTRDAAGSLSCRWPRRQHPTTSGSIEGGRLSTTNQPRSSSALAAVLRPAPVMPVTMTSQLDRTDTVIG